MAVNVDTAARLSQRLGSLLRLDAPLGARSTYRVGGVARFAVEVANEAELLQVAGVVAELSLPTLVVGKGSNLLIADEGFDGLAVFLGEGFEEIVPREGGVRAGAAASLPVVARRTARAGWAGFEWAVGVPGSIGGAVRMNAGGHGSDMATCLLRARVVDLATARARNWTPAELDLSYRHSALTSCQVVVWADLALRPGDPVVSRALLEDIVGWRRTHQPGGPNAGSVFTNPAGDSAGRLIEAAGGKGLRVGTAEVSTKHANFIQADSGGRAGDVWLLMHKVRQLVIDAGGPALQPETHLVGFGPFGEFGCSGEPGSEALS